MFSSPRARGLSSPPIPPRPTRTRRAGGYVLFEIVLAVIIFSVAALALAAALRDTIGVTGTLNRDRHVRTGLETILAEVRTKDLNEMSTEIYDEMLSVTYATTVEDAPLQTEDGSALEDLYLLRATATWEEGNNVLTETAEVLFYKPE